MVRPALPGVSARPDQVPHDRERGDLLDGDDHAAVQRVGVSQRLGTGPLDRAIEMTRGGPDQIPVRVRAAPDESVANACAVARCTDPVRDEAPGPRGACVRA